MRIQDALIKLLIRQPFYGSLASVLSLTESTSVKKLEMTLLPSPALKYNPEWFEALPDAQAMGALMHELLHLLLLHSLRRGERDPLLWAVCCDMAVNDHIPAEMLPESAVTTEQIELKVHHKLERMKSAEHYYQRLSALMDDKFSLLQREDSATLPSISGSLLEADIPKDEDFNQVNEAALQNKLKEMVQAASEDGELPPELQTEFTLTPKRSKLDWQNMFRRFLSGMGRMQIRATYKRESRRFDGFPGHKRSVGMKILMINRIKGAQLLVTEFDEACSEPKPAEAYRHQRNRTRKGGTDFRPIFKLAEELNIFSVVIFTDGNGNAPDEVNQRVLWILTHDGKQPAPYGYSVKYED